MATSVVIYNFIFLFKHSQKKSLFVEPIQVEVKKNEPQTC